MEIQSRRTKQITGGIQETMTNLKVLDLFAGCGGFSLGFQKAGFKIEAFIELDNQAINTFKNNFPDSKLITKDITKIQNHEIKQLKDIDIIIGGPPCQGYSLAGKRNIKDPRNQLYKEFLRFIEIIKPKAVVIENVPGILTMDSSEGKKVIDLIIIDLIKLGYFVSFKKLKAVDFNIPQTRERIFIIALNKDIFPKGNKLTNTVGKALKNISLKANSHLVTEPTSYMLERIKALSQGEKLNPKYNFSRQRLFLEKPSPTVSTKDLFIHPLENRFLTPRELARLQSFPDDFNFFGSKTSKIKQIGNAVPPELAFELAKKMKEEIDYG